MIQDIYQVNSLVLIKEDIGNKKDLISQVCIYENINNINIHIILNYEIIFIPL